MAMFNYFSVKPFRSAFYKDISKKQPRLEYVGGAFLAATFCAGIINSSPSYAVPPVWSTPPVTLISTQLLGANGDLLNGQQVEINGKGQVVTAWVKGSSMLQAKVRIKNQWGNAITLVSDGLGQTTNLLHLAESPLGEAVAVYTFKPTPLSASSTLTTFYNAGQWSLPAAIPATPGATVLNARVRYDGQVTLPATPTATLVWVEQTGTTCSIKAATGKAATGWSVPTTIGSGCYSFIQLAVNKRGEAAVALGTSGFGRRGSPAIVTSRNTAGVWSGLTDLGSLTYGTPPVVAIPNNGAAIALFSDAMLGVQWSRRSPTDGSWSAKQTLDGGVPAVPTGIAMAANGTAVAVYNSYYTNVPPSSLFASTLRAGSHIWSVPVSITDPNGTIESFQVSATPAGSFVVGWVDSAPTLPVGVQGSSEGVSALVAGTLDWSNSTLDGDMTGTFISPSPTAVSAAAGRAIVVWNNNNYDDSLTYVYSVLNAATTSIK